jgi:hypothetical protein
MTKGIAQQLCDGSHKLDEIARAIVATMSIILGQKLLFGEELGFIYESNAKENDWGAMISYRWVFTAHDDHGLEMKCQRVADVALIEVSYKDVFVLVRNKPTQLPPAADIQSIYDTLDGLIDSVFEKFPEVKKNLQPLLNAGK